MIAWLTRSPRDPEEEADAYWRLCRPEESWRWFTFLEATRDGMTGQFSFLPYPGAWADQPGWLIHDLTLLGEYRQMIKEQLKPGLQGRAGIA